MVERELQRQKMLRDMGFATWVAQAPLPGAMASPVLGAKPGAPAPKAPAATAPATPAATGESPQALLAQVRAGLSGERPSANTATADVPAAAKTPASTTTPRTPMRFTLQVLPMSFGYVMVQQKDPSAPGFSRNEQRLLQGFTALWGGYQGMARTFACPLGRQPMYADDAKEALGGYLAALSETAQAPNHQVLVLAEPEVAELMANQRYTAQPLGDGQLLVVSSLAEMLAAPVPHKRDSWNAILTAQFYAQSQHS